MHRDDSHDHLTELIARRETIEAAMAHYLAGDAQGAATGEEEAAAHRLFDVLLDGLEGRAGTPPRDLPAVRHHASRFGDGLAPVLRDALGPDIPDTFVARCVDLYWSALRAAAA